VAEDMSELDAEGLYKADPGRMTLASGRQVNPLALAPEDIDIWDIATALSRQCRYNGHTHGHLSVARHSIWVSNTLAGWGFDSQTQLAGLLHDAAEAYLGDMIRPLKQGELGKAYLDAEKGVEAKIALRFGIIYPFHESIHRADMHVLNEVELGPDGARWTYHGIVVADRAEFMNRFRTLVTLVKAGV
jgi:hypothetical protein